MKKYSRIIIYCLLFAILIGMFIYLGKKDFSDTTKQSDNVKFASEYSINKDNPFVYSYGSEIVDIIKNKSGIIYLGFSSNDWCKYYVKYLYDVLKDNDVKKVYYYDLLKDRSKNTKNYLELENLLSDYLYKLDNGNIHVLTPALLFVKNGKIIYFDDETSIERNNLTPDLYWTNENIDNFKNKINTYIKEVGIYE